MKTLRQMMKLNEHREGVAAIAEWAKFDPWKGLHRQLSESNTNTAATRVVRDLVQRMHGA